VRFSMENSGIPKMGLRSRRRFLAKEPGGAPVSSIGCGYGGRQTDEYRQMGEYQVYVIGKDGHTKQHIDLTCAADPANLKPGDFDKPPGKPRQYYWMNDYEMNAPILRGRRRGVYPGNHCVDSIFTRCDAPQRRSAALKNKLCVRSTDALKSFHWIKKMRSEWEDGDGCNWSGFSARADRTDEGSP
jgi:hypothetical protein